MPGCQKAKSDSGHLQGLPDPQPCTILEVKITFRPCCRGIWFYQCLIYPTFLLVAFCEADHDLEARLQNGHLNPFRHVCGSKCILEVCRFEFLWNLQITCVAGTSSYCHKLLLGVFTGRKRIRERKGCCCMDVFLLLSDVTVKFTSVEAHQIFTLSLSQDSRSLFKSTGFCQHTQQYRIIDMKIPLMLK